MPRIEEYRAQTDFRLADGVRYRVGASVRISAGAAKYPLLRGWIAPAPPPAPEPPPEPATPRRGARRRGA